MCPVATNNECVDSRKKFSIPGVERNVKRYCDGWKKFCEVNTRVYQLCPLTCGLCECRDIRGKFRFKEGIERTCNFISMSDRKDRLCKKQIVINNCPQTCGLCSKGECDNVPEVKAPVTLRLLNKTHEDHPYFIQMYISGGNADLGNKPSCQPDVVWKNQTNFWYLEVSPQLATGKTCPIQGGGSHFGDISDDIQNDPVDSYMTSTCNVYDFRLLISNHLSDPATVHYHGLTPPTPQDGVPLVTTPNIESNSMQYYRFQQLTYSGMYWMHSHWGFHEAYGIAAPIILQHDKSYIKTNNIQEDLIVQLEDNLIYPKCAFNNILHEKKCSKIPSSKWNLRMYLINHREEPLVMKPKLMTKKVRIRFLNAGVEDPWSIYNNVCPLNHTLCPLNNNHTKYGNTTVQPLEIIATDGNDVMRSKTSPNIINNFFLGIANRIDVIIDVNPYDQTVITAISNSGKVYRHIIIEGQLNYEPIHPDILPLFFNGKNTQKGNSPAETIANLKAQHPIKPRRVGQHVRQYVIVNRGGDFYGGFPLSIHNGSLSEIYEEGMKPGGNTLNDFVNDETNFMYQVHNYTALNNLKYQLHPFKTWYNSRKNIRISSTRKCDGCTRFSMPPPSSSTFSGVVNYSNIIKYPSIYNGPEGKDKSNWCCWEWCDVPKDECEDYELIDVTEYETNPHHIPVCYGDRVELSFLNYGFNDATSQHPIHLHGHDLSMKRIYSINGENEKSDTLVVEKDFKDSSGPLLDTYWVKDAFTVEFDAFNPGEHLLHCHIDLHLLNGMLTTVRYMNDIECNQKYLPKEYHGGNTEFPKHIYPPVTSGSPTPDPSSFPTSGSPTFPSVNDD